MLWIIPAILAIGTSCNRCTEDTVVSQRYIHKYGFDLTEKQWEEREKDGQIVLTRYNGVVETRTYENGILNGSVTVTFPKSDIIHRVDVYDQGILLKSIENGPSGLPLREEIYEFDNRKIITQWDARGAPMSIEEYEQDSLVEASYFSPQNELEAGIEEGLGTRVKRDRSGLLLLKDEISQGALASRKTFHPNGEVESVSHYQDYNLHGLQTFYTSSGNLFMEQQWNNGIMDGMKIQYREGVKVRETPYILGVRHGMEQEFSLDGKVIAEIQWEADQKHGSCRFYDEYETRIEWHFRGKQVSIDRFELLDFREKMMLESIQ